MLKLYGWRDQNDACWGLETIEIEVNKKDIKVDEDGEVEVNNYYYYLPEGHWFTSFAKAKKAALRKWKSNLETAKIALKDIRKLTKESIK